MLSVIDEQLDELSYSDPNMIEAKEAKKLVRQARSKLDDLFERTQV